jgi:regulator of sigma D
MRRPTAQELETALEEPKCLLLQQASLKKLRRAIKAAIRTENSLIKQIMEKYPSVRQTTRLQVLHHLLGLKDAL